MVMDMLRSKLRDAYISLDWAISTSKNKYLRIVLCECKKKVKVVDLCKKGASYIRERITNSYKNTMKRIEKHLAYPCISVNNIVWHISPLVGDDTILEENDIVKVYLGWHIDDIISIVSHTHVVQEGPVNGREADVIAAANATVKVALILDEPQKGDSKIFMGIGFVWKSTIQMGELLKEENTSCICFNINR
jgi:hypothetical protein